MFLYFINQISGLFTVIEDKSDDDEKDVQKRDIFF